MVGIFFVRGPHEAFMTCGLNWCQKCDIKANKSAINAGLYVGLPSSKVMHDAADMYSTCCFHFQQQQGRINHKAD